MSDINKNNFQKKASSPKFLERDFLQSEEWRKFQESVGRKTYNVFSTSSALRAPSPYKGEGEIEFWANVIEHKLPIVGKYFYIPRGPIINKQGSMNNEQYESLIDLAKENSAGWIRIDPETKEMLEEIKKNTKYEISKAPHDMQPKELFIIDITKPEEEILAGMKPKTRYNIRLAEKKGVLVVSEQGTMNNKYIDDFLRLTRVMAKRNKITVHPESYYRKMIEIIPGEMLKIYAAEYEGKVIAANIVIFYDKTCIYLHGASDDEYRNVMAPYLLQWQQIKDAKKLGCEKYDLGGIKSHSSEHIAQNTWKGITRFKLGFSPNTRPKNFPGSYDIIINSGKYRIYRALQRVKSFVK
ncbi:MAG TPA: peptidoglycan bridge formation glycyltransferase FemA/FemB family protein [Candidatus Moranbacteria bacterium]|nr:peptidoglycan bridge formation glycyltransferase FemA/FemB family protein [Candidatus Moranbacteria bacterium]